ncbi:MAG: TerC family protein [Verrucomicrobiia bacterium]
MTAGATLWTIFGVVVAAVLALDIGVFHRKAHAIRFREALLWSGLWIALALSYMGLVWWLHPNGAHTSLEFLTAYLVEESLSVDNLFVFLLIFSYFAVPSQYQYNCLFWGILGAMVFRAAFIVGGVALIQKFHWFLYALGVVLVVSGVKIALQNDRTIEPEKNPVLKLSRRFVPVATDYVGTKFFLRRDGRLMATPLFVVLLVVETTDIVFAMDSIPAVLGITRDTFVVYTSNVFAIMGLRALYFMLAGAMELFHHLRFGLSAVLVFIGAKMLLSRWCEIPVGIALPVVAGLLALSIIASFVWPKKMNDAIKE